MATLRSGRKMRGNAKENNNTPKNKVNKTPDKYKQTCIVTYLSPKNNGDNKISPSTLNVWLGKKTKQQETDSPKVPIETTMDKKRKDEESAEKFRDKLLKLEKTFDTSMKLPQKKQTKPDSAQKKFKNLVQEFHEQESEDKKFIQQTKDIFKKIQQSKYQRSRKKTIINPNNADTFHDLVKEFQMQQIAEEKFIQENEDTVKDIVLYREKLIRSEDNNNSSDDSTTVDRFSDEKTCRHLRLKDIKKMWLRYMSFIEKIYNGEVKSKRHQLYQEHKNDPNLKDLSSLDGSSLLVNHFSKVFTEEQEVYMVKLFRRHFDNENIYQNSLYYFKVLVPEFSKIIFMDIHNMSSRQVQNYVVNLNNDE